MGGAAPARNRSSSAIAPGFGDYVMQAHGVFRAALDAMSGPGTVYEVSGPENPPVPLDPATAALALSLFDHDTEIWLGDGIAGIRVYEYLRFCCGCHLTKSGLNAGFALVRSEDGVPALGQFNPGSDEFPDRSTTMIPQVPGLDSGPEVRLTGPGIDTERLLRVAGVPRYFWRERQEQQELFPCGIDLIFTCGARLVALPRSTEIEV